MFNRNYYNYLAILASGVSNSTRLTMKNVSGKTQSIQECGEFGSLVASSSSSESVYMSDKTKFCLRFGTGTTAPTIDDYKLSNFISLTQTSAATISSQYDETTNIYSKNYSLLIQNNGSSAITVAEYGLYKRLNSDASSSSMAMIAHEVLSEPFTIPAGDSVTFKFIISYKYPQIEVSG